MSREYVVVDDGEQVLTEYDDSGQPLAVRSATQFYVINAAYDRFGRVKRIQHGNDVVDTWAFDNGDGHRLRRRVTQRPSVVSQKSCAQSGEPSAGLARRATAGISGIFPGGATPPGPARAGGVCAGLLRRDTSQSPYLDLVYEAYDPRGLLTQVRDQRDAVGQRTNTADYTYDHMGRLTSVDSPHPAYDRLYDYDPLGNITRHGDQFFEYDPNKRHQITKVHLGSAQGPYTSVDHDLNGNRTGKSGQSYTYTAEDRVASITAGGQVSEFLYDHAGRQVARRAGGAVTRYYSELAETADGTLTKWYFLGGRRIAMRQTTNTAFETAALGDGLFRFAAVSAGRPMVVVQVAREAGLAVGLTGLLLTAGLWIAPGHRRRPVVGIALRRGRVIVVAALWGTGTLPWPLLIQPPPAEAQSDVIRHYHLDHLGSTQVITSATGTLLEQIRYHAYGDVRGRWNAANGTLTPSPTGRQEFTGYETQLASGLQYAGARFYDPTLGSFLTHDPMAEFPNPYTYVSWNPVNATDPTGALMFAPLFGLALVIAGVAASAIQSGVNGASARQAIDNALVGALSGLTFQYAVIGPVSNAFAGAATYVEGAQIAYGAYSAVEGFRSEQYVQAGFGAVMLAYGLLGLAGASQADVAQGANAAVDPGSSGYDIQQVAYDPGADPAEVRARIAEFAEAHLGDESYALDSQKGDFRPGDWKCNCFVRDAIEAGGGRAPTYSGGKWPVQANTWANPKTSLRGWQVVSSPRPGDIAAFPRAGTSGHVGVYVGGWGRTVIGAGQYGVGYSTSHFGVGIGAGRLFGASGPIVYRRWVGLSGVGI